MKQLLIIALLLTTVMHSQSGFEIQLYQGASDFNRQKIKVLRTHESFKGITHIALGTERFTLDNDVIKYNAVGIDAEFGYAFTNFKAPIELMPLLSYGWFVYDEGRWGKRLILGLDLAYIISNNFKLHLLVNVGKENWMTAVDHDLGGITATEYTDFTQNNNNVFIGISYNL